MFDLDNWQEIWATITRNKMRSFLTGFGVFWGIFMLIILVGIGNGFGGGIEKNFSGVASNACFFFTDRTSEAYKGHRAGRYWNMRIRDMELIRHRALSVEHISPILFGGSITATRESKNGSYGMRGVSPSFFEVDKQNALKGRLINEIDIEGRRKVCVIGEEVYETLFDIGEDPVGQYIKLAKIQFQVVGVISSMSKVNIGGNIKRSIIIPFTTMQRVFSFSWGDSDAVHFLACTAKKGYTADVVEQEVLAILKEVHDISPTDDKAIMVVNVEKEFLMMSNLLMGVDILIWIVGLGALFSGIIGISNIMLVTVRERMREIGVRRAIGATPIKIIIQIMSESFVLTSIAGLSGFMFGVGVLSLIQNAMKIGGAGEGGMMLPPFISFNLALVAMFILIVSGLIAGLMPAMRALQIKAIDAIRDE